MGSSGMLEVRGLSVEFGGVKALDNVDFRLAQGELRCLIGPNGAGKTTFFKCLTGQLRPNAGQVVFNGRNISAVEPFQIARSGIGIKTQVPSLFDGLSVSENMWLALRKVRSPHSRDAEVLAILDRFGIGPLAQSIVGQLAHGQRQLVELALVISGDPELVLLDEPAAGMAADEIDLLVRTIVEMNQTHTLIVVEHDMQFIRMIGRHVTVFHQGRILIEGAVADVLTDPVVRDVYLGHARAA